MSAIAIIGTAGRDKGRTYDIDLWCKMWDDALKRFDKDKEYRLVSGGAAWADHLAVELYLYDPNQFSLTLCLPAPLEDSFVGEYGSAGAAANYYHKLFTNATGIDSLRQIRQARDFGANVFFEKEQPGMGAFFARNIKVAKKATACLAYTWGEGKEPTDGGTKYTWDRIVGRRVHVSLDKLTKG